MPVSVISGDLLTVDADIICHQCNCVSRSAAGLAKAIFDKWPHTNIYETRIYASTPGEVFFQRATNDKVIAHMIGQFSPGPPKKHDSSEGRITAFQKCLDEIARRFLGMHIKIAFPVGIGCGLAGGHWPTYKAMIQNFSDKNPHLTVLLVKKEK